jgi:L-threonylcarbamoyladenylate synthase
LSAEILKINPQDPEPTLVNYVVERLRKGHMVGMPTDTFYGLAVDPLNLHAVESVYEIKSRKRHKPLSLIVESVDQAEDLADVDHDFHALARRFWPGPLTIIVKASSSLPLKVTANTGNVALRVPDSAIPIAIVKRFGFPITATSANLSGMAECTTSEKVRSQMGDRIPLIIDGGTTKFEMASTIVDLTAPDGWSIQREGAISAEQIMEVLG